MLGITAALLSVFRSDASAQSPPERTDAVAEITPFVGWMKVDNDAVEEDAVVLGAEISITRGRIRWTPLEIVTPMPGTGAYVKASAGVGVVMRRGSYVGLLIGTSRFDSANLYAAGRVGVVLPLPFAPVLEIRLERHRETARVGSTESVSIRVPMRFR